MEYEIKANLFQCQSAENDKAVDVKLCSELCYSILFHVQTVAVVRHWLPGGVLEERGGDSDTTCYH